MNALLDRLRSGDLHDKMYDKGRDVARGGLSRRSSTIGGGALATRGGEPDEDAVREVDKKLRAWHRALASSGRAGGGDGGGGGGDGVAREGKRRKSAADERAEGGAEDAALDGGP